MGIVFPLFLIAGLPLALFTAFGFRLRFKPSRSRLFVAVIAYAVSFVGVAAVSFLLVMVIAGPHTGVLEPSIYTQITFLVGLLIVLIVPFFAAYVASRRAGNCTDAG